MVPSMIKLDPSRVMAGQRYKELQAGRESSEADKRGSVLVFVGKKEWLELEGG